MKVLFVRVVKKWDKFCERDHSEVRKFDKNPVKNFCLYSNSYRNLAE